MINTKEDLIELVNNNLPKYKLIEKYFGKAINNKIRKDMPVEKLLEYSLIRYMAMDNIGLKNLESYLNERLFTNIERPINRLIKDFDQYSKVFSELYVAKLLSDERMSNITFLKESGEKTPDIQYKENGIVRYAEVKSMSSLNPDFDIFNNKLQAKSLLNKSFNKTFTFSCNYSVSAYENIKSLYEDLSIATDKLIMEIEPKLEIDNLTDYKSIIDQFEFVVSANNATHTFVLMSWGRTLKYSGPEDFFLDLSTVYCRFISNFKKAYSQILSIRNGNTVEAINDRIYLFLKTEKFESVFEKETNNIFNNLASSLGMDKLAKIIFQI